MPFSSAIGRLAGEHAARYFKQSFELKIKGDVIPEAAVEPLLAELQELFARHGASAALSAKATIKPTKEFASALRRCPSGKGSALWLFAAPRRSRPAGCTLCRLSRSARLTLFSVEQNHELDKVVPISASVKPKLGRGGSDDE